MAGTIDFLSNPSGDGYLYPITVTEAVYRASDGQSLTNIISEINTSVSGKASLSHSHSISDITNLQSTLDNKASSNHTHTIANITNLQTTLDGKASSNHNHDSAYAKLSHAHAISDITNLQTSLDGKQPKGSYAAASHDHSNTRFNGNLNQLTGVTKGYYNGLSMYGVYNNGYPVTYGNVIGLRGLGCGEILVGWSGTSGAYTPMYFRSQRDVNDANWSGWARIYNTLDRQVLAQSSAPGDGDRIWVL